MHISLRIIWSQTNGRENFSEVPFYATSNNKRVEIVHTEFWEKFNLHL